MEEQKINPLVEVTSKIKELVVNIADSADQNNFDVRLQCMALLQAYDALDKIKIQELLKPKNN